VRLAVRGELAAASPSGLAPVATRIVSARYDRSMVADADLVREKRERRDNFLTAVYRVCDGKTSRDADSATVGASIGLSQNVSIGLEIELREKGLLAPSGGSRIRLTLEGQRVAEALLTGIDPYPQPTGGPASLHVGTMYGSAIQMGVSDSTQSVLSSPPELQAERLLDSIQGVMSRESRRMPPPVRFDFVEDRAKTAVCLCVDPVEFLRQATAPKRRHVDRFPVIPGRGSTRCARPASRRSRTSGGTRGCSPSCVGGSVRRKSH
jgi:hypothetical protein